MRKNFLGFKTKICYGAGSLGYGSIGQTVSSCVMFFGTSVLGLSGVLVGIVVALTSLWDGISDPLVGFLSDKTKSKRFGRRIGFMLFACFALAINNIFLWTCPSFDNKIFVALWLLVFLLMQETFNTFFSTPYSALGIDIAPDYNDQTQIQGYKTVFSIFGMILPSILMWSIMPHVGGQLSKSGYIYMATINSLVFLICGLLSCFGSLKRARAMPNYEKSVAFEKKTKFDLKKLLLGYFEIFKKKDFRSVMLGYSVCLIAMAFISSVGMHLFTFCYHFSSAQISILMFCLFGGAILSQFLWINVVKKYDKKQTLIFALSVMLLGIALSSVTFLFRMFFTTNHIFCFVAPCLFVCGIGAGALYSLPHSMYADVVTLEQFRTGQNNAGRYTGYYTFTYNFTNSISLFVVGVLLDVVGFDSTKDFQILSVQSGLAEMVFFGSAIALTLAILIFSNYGVKRSDVLKVQIKSSHILRKG